MDCSIIQRINTTHQIPPFNEYSAVPSVVISIKGGKYGVVDAEGRELLPFMYDNIFVHGFGLLISIQNGKMGLIHLGENKVDGDTVSLQINRVIPCEYDYIHSQRGTGTVFLKKWTESGFMERCYLTTPGVLTPFGQDLQGCGQEYISITIGEENLIIHCQSGETIISSDEHRTIGHYQTDYAVVFQQYSYKSNKSRLIAFQTPDDDSAAPNMYKTVEFISECHGIFDVEEDSPASLTARGFIVDLEDGFAILNEKCDPISSIHPLRVKIKIGTEFDTDLTGRQSVFFPKAGLSTEIHHELFYDLRREILAYREAKEKGEDFELSTIAQRYFDELDKAETWNHCSSSQ